MNPEEYRRIRKELGTQVQVAALLGVRQPTVSDRETGRRQITREAELALRSLSAPRPFPPQLQAISDLLTERGFRLGRGTYACPDRGKLPTLSIKRTDKPEWPGAWSPVYDDFSDETREAQTALDLAAIVFENWHREKCWFEGEERP